MNIVDVKVGCVSREEEDSRYAERIQQELQRCAEETRRREEEDQVRFIKTWKTDQTLSILRFPQVNVFWWLLSITENVAAALIC